MMIPYAHNQSEEERKRLMYERRLRKAKHLANRVTQFLNDLKKSELTVEQREEIRKVLHK